MIYLDWHLGLGDAIVCNGLVRYLAMKEEVMLPCYKHNLESVNAMFCGTANIFTCKNTDPIKEEWKKISLGHNRGEAWNDKEWDKEFYRQADIPFSDRWSRFFIDKQSLIYPAKSNYTLYVGKIGLYRKEYISSGDNICTDMITNNICDWAEIIKNASMIHCYDCGMLNLINSFYLECPRFLHQYIRPEYPYGPTLRGKWEIIK